MLVPQEMTGEVFAYDKYTKTLVLKEGDTIRMINANMIKSPRVRTATESHLCNPRVPGLPFPSVAFGVPCFCRCHPQQ